MTPGVKATAQPVVDASRAYFLESFDEHVVTAVDKANGRVLWRRQLTFIDPPDFLDSGFGLALVNGILVVGDNEMFGLDPGTGSVRWQQSRKPTRGLARFSRFSTDGSLVYPAMDAHVFAFDATSGALRWETNPTQGQRAGIFIPQVDRGTVFVGFYAVDGGRRGGVGAIDVATGQLRWSQLLPDWNSTGINLVTRLAILDTVIVAPAADGSAYVLNRSTGVILKVLPRSTFYSAGEVPDQDGENYAVHSTVARIFVANNAGRITALDAQTLTPVWSAYDRPVTGTVQEMVSDDQFLYVTVGNGTLGVRRLLDGKLIWYVTASDLRPDRMEGTLRAPAVQGEFLYYGGYGFASYAFRRR